MNKEVLKYMGSPPKWELVKIFPESIPYINEKIRVLLEERERTKQRFREIIHKCEKEVEVFLVRDCYSEKLERIDREIRRLKGYFSRVVLEKGKTYLPIEEIKSSVSIVEVFGRLCPDRRLKKSGDKYSCLCPFHSEKHPSFCLYPETNTFYCFGCGEAGDVFDLVMKLEGFSFKEAIVYLQGGENE